VAAGAAVIFFIVFVFPALDISEFSLRIVTIHEIVFNDKVAAVSHNSFLFQCV